ncbi:MAG: hypothetical protein LBU81_06510 [Methanosarcinales archaeon]|jgi:hypothetical protein|nr:hypothetical protein [Methanosarcinales archaeon]
MDYYKNFISTFDRLNTSNNSRRVFEDFVELSACTITHREDILNLEERDLRRFEILKNYDSKDSELFSELFYIAAGALTEKPEQDFLGAVSERLNLGLNLMSYDLAVTNAATILFGEDLNEMPIRFMDTAAGAGTQIIAMANALKKNGVNYQNDVYFVAADPDRTAALMCYIQMSLLGCAGTVTVSNSPTDETFSVLNTPMLFNGVWDPDRKIAAVMNHLKGIDFVEEAKTRPEIKTLSDL